MKEITLHKQWLIKAPIEDVFRIITDFEKLPKYFPKVAEMVEINKRDGNNLEMEAIVKSFGKKFKVKMKTQILPGRGFISDNDSYQFGTSGHEELLLSEQGGGTLVDYTYKVTIHKMWLRIIATPLIKWYSMKAWEKAVIDELKKIVEKRYPEEKNINEQTQKAITLFHEIAQGAKNHNWKIAFLSGFAIDAHFGYLTKNHRDVDIIISKEQGAEIVDYLKNLGHIIYEEEKSKGECLKVDQADPEKPSRCHADIHYFWEEDGKVVIPLNGKKLIFSDSFSNITEEIPFLGEDVRVLKPKYLAEEKNGWRDQIGLPQSEEREKSFIADMEKISFIISK